MKKYIFGFISAICLMWAGCNEFEDYTSADLGKGPSVEVSMDTVYTQGVAVMDAFSVTIVPGEEAKHYAYLLTTDSMAKVDPMTLLTRGYGNVQLFRVDTMPKIEFTKEHQPMEKTYFVYAVAANHQGLCGDVAVGRFGLPDKEAPHLVKLPQGNMFTAFNNDRSIKLEFNEVVVRGEGAITFEITGADSQGMPTEAYAQGAIEDIVINSDEVTITLPESVTFRKEESFSYIFLDFAEGAFVDVAGNNSAALKGGLDGSNVNAPWWMHESDNTAPYLVNIPEGYQYTASEQGYKITLEFNEAVVRGEGAINYAVAGEDGYSYYAQGAVAKVTVNGSKVAVYLPDVVTFDETQTSYVFLDFAEGAFADAAGNLSAALKGGVNDQGEVAAPWWEYIPGGGGGNSGEAMVGTYGFIFQFLDTQTGNFEDCFYAVDTEFSLKYPNSNDTILISNFFDADAENGILNYPLEAGMNETGFAIPDFQVLNQLEMQDNGGNVYNVLWIFGGFANSENEQFDEVKFTKTFYDDGSYDWVADRLCGIILLDYDALMAGNTNAAFLGYYGVFANSFFIEGSAFSSSVMAMPKNLPFIKEGFSVKSSGRKLQPSEKAKIQKQLKGFSISR